MSVATTLSHPGTRGATVLVVGEAIADVVAQPQGAAPALTLTAYAGGSPSNVAVGLARLGVRSAFAGRLSAQGLGPWLRHHLSSNDVDTGRSVQASEPCTLALVTVDRHGVASYSFYVQGTADWQWRHEELPDSRSPGVNAVHSGSLAAALAPGRDVVLGWLAEVRASGNTFVSVDPNVRLGLVDDVRGFRERIDTLVGSAHLVKASVEDIGAVYPGSDPVEVARRWVRSGPEMVVVTDGPRGAFAVRRQGDPRSGDGEAEVVKRGAPAVTVVDTVGAGDAFMSGLLARLNALGALSPGGCNRLDEASVAGCLEYANRVAAMTCTRPGADPPLLAEIEEVAETG